MAYRSLDAKSESVSMKLVAASLVGLGASFLLWSSSSSVAAWATTTSSGLQTVSTPLPFAQSKQQSRVALHSVSECPLFPPAFPPLSQQQLGRAKEIPRFQVCHFTSFQILLHRSFPFSKQPPLPPPQPRQW